MQMATWKIAGVCAKKVLGSPPYLPSRDKQDGHSETHSLSSTWIAKEESFDLAPRPVTVYCLMNLRITTNETLKTT